MPALSNSWILSSNFRLGNSVFLQLKCQSIWAMEMAGRVEEKFRIGLLTTVSNQLKRALGGSYLLWSAITLSCEVSRPISLRVALWKLLNYILEHARLILLPCCLQNLTTKQLHFTRVEILPPFYRYMLIIQQFSESSVIIQSKSILICIKTLLTCTESNKTFIKKASAALQAPLQNHFPNSPYPMRIRKRFISTYVLYYLCICE